MGHSVSIYHPTIPHTNAANVIESPDISKHDDKISLSIVDMLLYFLPTFPMFHVNENSSSSSKTNQVNTNNSVSSDRSKLDHRKCGITNYSADLRADDSSSGGSAHFEDSIMGGKKNIFSHTDTDNVDEMIPLSSKPSFHTSRYFDTNAPKKSDLISIGKLAFSLAHIIGRGSFGTVVYAGAHVEFGRAAIKAISKEGWNGRRQMCSMEYSNYRDESYRAVTPAEVMAIADRKILLMISQRGAHQNVVRYFGFEEDANFMYLAIELCEVSLWSVFYERSMLSKRLQFRDILKQQNFTKQLLEGVQFLHSQQIVHGDLRPKNVLFDYNGLLKITDFGLAQKVSFEDDSFSWQHGGPDGSGGWFAPEVYLKGRKTMAVDLFSAGCMIFWVASDGLHPFDNNPFNVVQGHYQKHVLCGKPELLDLIGWMVSHNFENRPSVDDILSHPFLWNNTTRVLYLTEVGNKIDQYKDLLEDVCWACGSDSDNRALKSKNNASQIHTSTMERRWVCVCKCSEQQPSWRKIVHEKLMMSLTRRRKYPSDSTAWFIRFFRNLDQHFHDQTDEGLLCLKTSLSSENNDLTDADFLDVVRSSSLKQREVIGKYITTVFPNFFLSVWLKVGSLEF